MMRVVILITALVSHFFHAGVIYCFGYSIYNKEELVFFQVKMLTLTMLILIDQFRISKNGIMLTNRFR